MQATSLFNKNLIGNDVAQYLPEGFEIRPLQIGDFDKGFLETLSHLTTVGQMTKTQFLDRFEFMRRSAFHYFVVVIEDLASQKIAASGTIVIERKFIHEGGLVGHIEDIVSNSAYRGKNLGRAIIEALKSIGGVVGCYKIILDCSDKNVPFYQKLGFAKKEVEMALYLENKSKL